MKPTLILLLAFLFFSFHKVEPTKPNIILILADDLGYGDLGCFGSKSIKTPHLDKLATEGVRLTQFYSGSTVCAPSRCALLTGKHTGNAYIRGNGDVPLRPTDVTIPEILKQQGYQTALFGKWGLGDINTEGSPNHKGWDRFFGFLFHVEAHYQMPGIGWKYSPESPKLERARFGRYACDIFADSAVAFLKNQGNQKPFFMELALTIPHAELYADKEAMQRYQDAEGNSIWSEKPFIGSHYGGQPTPKAAYAAMVSKADDYVGKIVEALKINGLDKNTLIVYTSDNGTHVEGGRTMEDVKLMQSSGALRGVKRDMYDGGVRVPTIVWGLDLPKNSVREGQGAFWDLLSTFSELAGIKNVPTNDGVSLWQHWKTGAALVERPLYWEFYEGGIFQAVRLGDWKYVYAKPQKGEERVELYDLKNDVGEKQNLANEKPRELAKLKDLAQKMHIKSEHPSFRRSDE